MPTWADNKRLKADPFAGQVCRLLKECAHIMVEFVEADTETDQKRNGDFVARAEKIGLVACRVRAMKYWPNPGDVTIRNGLGSGSRTEADKIIAGLGQWMFYGWQDGTKIIAWALLDLDVVRRKGLIQRERVEGRVISNGDGTSFIAMRLLELWQVGALKSVGGEATSKIVMVTQATSGAAGRRRWQNKVEEGPTCW